MRHHPSKTAVGGAAQVLGWRVTLAALIFNFGLGRHLTLVCVRRRCSVGLTAGQCALAGVLLLLVLVWLSLVLAWRSTVSAWFDTPPFYVKLAPPDGRPFDAVSHALGVLHVWRLPGLSLASP